MSITIEHKLVFDGIRLYSEETGEFINGKYFWSSDMILVDEVSRARIDEVVELLIKKHEFEQIFRECKQV